MAKYNVVDCNAVTYADNDKIRFPRFQRKKTWDNKDNFKLCISIFKGYPIGVVIINELGGYEYLLDGRQRLNALRLMKSDPKEVYRWAKSFVGFSYSEDIEELKTKFWLSIDEYLQHEASKNDRSDSDTATPNSDTSNEDDGVEAYLDPSEDEKRTFDFDVQYKSLTTLLDLVLLCHPFKQNKTNLEKMYLFNRIIDESDLFEYVDAENGEYVVNSCKLWDFIGNLSKQNCKTVDQFTSYFIRRFRLANTPKESIFKSWIYQHWNFYQDSMVLFDRLRSVLNQASVGQIKLINAEPLDAQNIFSLVNHSGTPLSSEELFSARPFWNIKLRNPSYDLLKYKKEMYEFLGIDLPDDTCRWDLCSSFLKRIDSHSLIFEGDNKFVTSISLSYRLLSAILVGGMSSVCTLNLEKASVDWETDIERLIIDLNMMISILEDMETFKYMMEWNQSIMSLTSHAIAIEFCALLYKVWKNDLNRPSKTSANRKTFERYANYLFDRLVFEYSSRIFSGSSDSLVASHLNEYKDRISQALPSDEWVKFIDEIDSGYIRGKKTSPKNIKPFIYYYYIINKKRPTMKDGVLDGRYEIDHIVAQNLFKDNPLAESKYKDNYLNFSILPKGTNIEKNDKRLKDITDTWLRDQIKYYSGISDDDFDTLSDITQVSKLKEIRKEQYIDAFTDKRTANLANI